MAIGSFRHLCEGFCEIAGVETPPLIANDEGLIAFHMKLRGVTINVVHSPESSADHAFILVECGAIPHKLAQRAMQALLEANFFWLQVHPPTFSRNPATGDAVLQFVYPFQDATPTGLFALIDQGVVLALRWQQDCFIPAEPMFDPAPALRSPAMLPTFA